MNWSSLGRREKVIIVCWQSVSWNIDLLGVAWLWLGAPTSLLNKLDSYQSGKCTGVSCTEGLYHIFALWVGVSGVQIQIRIWFESDLRPWMTGTWKIRIWICMEAGFAHHWWELQTTYDIPCKFHNGFKQLCFMSKGPRTPNVTALARTLYRESMQSVGGAGCGLIDLLNFLMSRLMLLETKI